MTSNINTENEHGVRPLDFLFCPKCEKHIGNQFYLQNISVKTRQATEEERKNRVATIDIKARPVCSKCSTPVIQKYVYVKGTVKI
jgi:hypothetical protein